MGKKKNQAENGKKSVSVEVLDATEKIAALATKEGILLTDRYAVLKELWKVGSTHPEQHFTRWGEENGERTLLVLCKDKIKSYPNYSTYFASTRTVKS
jgi:hypothetical protein